MPPKESLVVKTTPATASETLRGKAIGRYASDKQRHVELELSIN